jgi:hypothetical protein
MSYIDEEYRIANSFSISWNHGSGQKRYFLTFWIHLYGVFTSFYHPVVAE